MDQEKKVKITGAERKQKRLFKYKRAGIVLTQDEIKKIKIGRKELRRQMRDAGVKAKKEFELTASSLGLYFDKSSRFALLLWLFSGRGLALLLGAALLALLTLWGFSAVTEMKGHFTISMSDELFKEGFTISETVGFENPTTHLFATPAESVPCISISSIPMDVDKIDGPHHDTYFAYTFYVRNDGENAQDMSWRLRINSESNKLSKAAWVMLFEDGKMTLYAKGDEDGNPEMLPAKDDNTRGYVNPPLYEFAADPDNQYEIVKKRGQLTFWRVKPKDFISDLLVENGLITQFKPQEVHKFTVVIWLEGDDPQCNDELIGGHLGMDFFMNLEEGMAN